MVYTTENDHQGQAGGIGEGERGTGRRDEWMNGERNGGREKREAMSNTLFVNPFQQ